MPAPQECGTLESGEAKHGKTHTVDERLGVVRNVIALKSETPTSKEPRTGGTNGHGARGPRGIERRLISLAHSKLEASTVMVHSGTGHWRAAHANRETRTPTSRRRQGTL